jgi:hypothetical protein
MARIEPGLGRGRAFQMDLRGEEELLRRMNLLENKFGVQQSRAVLRKASSRVMIPAWRNAMTVNSKNLRRSFGNITGKAKQTAVVFAGPRIDSDRRSRRKTPMGRITVTIAAKFKGHLANIIENNKFGLRYPGEDQNGRKRSKPRVPGFGGYPHDVREHTGKFRARPFIKKTARANMPKVLNMIDAELTKAVIEATKK